VAGGFALMLLDTCALLWLARGGKGLTREALRRIREAPVVCVSAITGFEIGVKVRKGKLSLPATPSEWIRAVIEHHDLRMLPLDLGVCVRATELPAIHADPCDRMIIATAEQHHLTIVSADSAFSLYGVKVMC